MDYVDEDEPLRTDFDEDDEEYYLEALEEYNEYINSLDDYFCIARVDIDDPGDIERFKERFIGRKYFGRPNVELEENDERIATYYLDIKTKDGVNTDINVFTQAMEYDGVKGGSFDECYPDYELLEKEFEKYLDNLDK